MEVSGEIKQVATRGWLWKLGNKNSDGEWICPTFSDDKYFNDLSFWIKPKDKLPDYGKLYLLQVSEDAYKEPRDYKLHVKLTYCEKEKEFTINTQYGKLKGYKHGCGHILKHIKTSTLLEISCKFLKMTIYFKIDRKIDEKEVDNKQEENLKKSKYEDEKVDNEITYKGLNALSENLKDAYLCEKDSDVILNVRDQKYPAHKVILRVRSPVFKAMLEHDMKEKNEGVVDISDCDPHIFQDLLLYLYAGKLDNISEENVFELYHMSDKYEVKELKATCINFMLKNLTVDIICDALSLAIKNSELDLLAGSTEFFTANADDILETAKWKMFMKEYPEQANELFLTTSTTIFVHQEE